MGLCTAVYKFSARGAPTLLRYVGEKRYREKKYTGKSGRDAGVQAKTFMQS